MNQTLANSLPAARGTGRRASPWCAVLAPRHRAPCRDALLPNWQRHHVPPDHVDRYEVPGAFEIPLHAQRLARAGAHDAIVACGLVVDGGIYRHDFVAHAVIDALMRVQLDTDVPVFSAVLTPQAFHEHVDHRSFFGAHFEKKGIEAAQACLGQLAALQRLAA
jgi:6,7-dimethyl-8-ribityllumazine synthase